MRVPLAWRNVVHERARAAVGIAGVMFAIMLIFLQLGFYNSVIIGATQVYDQIDYDLVIVARDYSYMHSPQHFPRTRLYQALGCLDVLTARALYVGDAKWRNPETGLRNSVVMFGFDPRRPVFRTPSINAHLQDLCRMDTALVDSDTRPKYGPRAAGDRVEIAGRKVEIVDQYKLGTAFVELGMITLSDENFVRLQRGRTLEQVGIGIIRLRSGADAQSVAGQLRRLLPADVNVWTRDQFRAHEVRHWLVMTSTGIIFGSGVLVAVIVGVVILYQTISSQIMSKLNEYATLKAIGYTPLQILRIVLGQALLISTIGFLPGLGMGLLLYIAVAHRVYLPMVMTGPRIVAVFMMSVVMSVGSGLLAYRKVHVAEPADLF
jgi:putative ABC transport system permease protein